MVPKNEHLRIKIEVKIAVDWGRTGESARSQYAGDAACPVGVD
jgi:hypothetical protein